MEFNPTLRRPLRDRESITKTPASPPLSGKRTSNLLCSQSVDRGTDRHQGMLTCVDDSRYKLPHPRRASGYVRTTEEAKRNWPSPGALFSYNAGLCACVTYV